MTEFKRCGLSDKNILKYQLFYMCHCSSDINLNDLIISRTCAQIMVLQNSNVPRLNLSYLMQIQMWIKMSKLVIISVNRI